MAAQAVSPFTQLLLSNIEYMKPTFRLLRYSFSFFDFALAAPLVFALAMVSPLRAQSEVEVAPGAAPDSLPQSAQKAVQVMVELSDPAAAAPYAEALKVAQAQADAARINALAHPNTRTSKAILTQKQPVQISSTAASQIKNIVQQLDQAQRQLLPALTGPAVGGQVMFRAQRAYNGIAVIVSPDKIAAIASLPGVKAVHPMHPKC